MKGLKLLVASTAADHTSRTIATSMGEDDATTPAAALAGCLAATAEVPE